MTPHAADLPDGSVVATADTAYIKTHPTAWSQWRGTHGGYLSDALIDDAIAAGAKVLRAGAECTVADGQMFHVQRDDKGN